MLEKRYFMSLEATKGDHKGYCKSIIFKGMWWRTPGYLMDRAISQFSEEMGMSQEHIKVVSFNRI